MHSDEEILRCIETVLHDIRPNMQMDGGDIELVSYRSGVVSVRLFGTCKNCISSQSGMKALLEDRLKDCLSEIHEVLIIDDR